MGCRSVKRPSNTVLLFGNLAHGLWMTGSKPGGPGESADADWPRGFLPVLYEELCRWQANRHGAID